MHDGSVSSSTSAVRPDAEMGARACENAGGTCPQGSVGAGTGATVGKLDPTLRPAKCGLGTASLTLPNGARLGALAAVNASRQQIEKMGKALSEIK